MNDPEIRALLYPMLRGERLDELTIGNATGEMTRADVVDLLPDAMHGYELKGDGDTLKRLPLQLLCYGRVFDRVTFVVTEKHAKNAYGLLPSWVGLYVAFPDEVWPMREPQQNPNLSRQHIAMLLWQAEAIAFMKRHGLKALTKHRCWECRDMIDQAAHISTLQLTAFVSACIVARLEQKAKRKVKNRIIRQHSK